MALTLHARATLNTKGFTDGIKRMAAAQAGLSNSTATLADKDVDATNKRIAATTAAGVAAGKTGKEHERATREMEKANSKLAASTSSGFAAQRYLYADVARSLALASAATLAFPAAALAAGIAWEKDFADVVRTSDPALAKSDAAVGQLKDSLVSLVQTMPTSWGNVTEIATLANQMGIATNDTVRFTSAVAMFAATSNVSVDQAATAFARLKAIVPDVGSDFMGLADAILKVGVNSIATESEIINIVTQISSIAGAAGMGSRDMIGLAGAMASVRIPPELSRGVVTRVFGQISRATADGGASLAGFAKIAGMSAEDFRKSWGEDGDTGQAFLQFINGLRDLGPRAEAELRGLGITSVRDVPVMLRLANAADSEGNVGGLLKQTMNDAQNSAGETQRQYTIMADTVSAKLKVVGNNIMAFFEAIGQNGLGPLGDILDGVGEALSDITNSLDKNVRLFGGLELPFNNGELIGTLAVIGGITSGVLLLGSAFAKLMQYRATIGQVMGGLNTSSTGATVVATSMQKTADNARKVNSSIGPMFVTMGQGFRGASDSARRLTDNIRGVDRQFVGTINQTNKLADGFKSAGRAGGVLASLAFGPLGIGIGIAALAITGVAEATKGASTEVSELAERLAALSSIESISGVSNAIKDIEVGGLLGTVDRPLAEGYQSDAELYRKALDNMSNDATGQSFGYEELKGKRNTALETLDAALDEMNRSGNTTQAAFAFKAFTQSADEMYEALETGKMSKMKRSLETAFELNGLEYTQTNVEDFYNNKLPAVSAAFYGVSDSVNLTTAQIEDLGMEGFEAFSAVSAKVDEVALSFISLADAMSVYRGEDGKSKNLQGFNESLTEQIAAQEAWATNLAKLGQIGGTEAVSAFMEMGPEGADILAQVVANHENTGGSIEGIWYETIENIKRTQKEGVAQMGVDVAAARDTLMTVLQDANLVAALANEIEDPAKFAAFSAAASTVGHETATRIAQGIKSGSKTVDQAIFEILGEDYNIKMGADLNLTQAQLSANLFKATLAGDVSFMQLGLLPELAEGQAWDFKVNAEGQTVFFKTNAETGEAVDKVQYFVDTNSNKVIPIKVETQGVAASQSAIDQIRGKTVTVYVDTVQRGPGMAIKPTGILYKAQGGVLEAYAQGGVREDHRPQILPAGVNRMWAEPETGGEAYIPFAKDRRKRAVGILNDVANRFGYNLSNGTELARYSQGGFHDLQTRAMYGRMMTNRTGNNEASKNVNLTFVNPVEKDWAKDARAKADLIGAIL